MNLDLTSRRTLASSLPKDFKLAVEVGVREGWFSRYILQNSSMEVHSIDPWEKNKELGHPHEAYEICKKNLVSFGDRSKMIKAYSPQASEGYSAESIDFVYIDGLHDYHSVINDIKAWWDKIKPGGVLCGHDYNPKVWPGVCQSVNEFCQIKKLTFSLTGLDQNFVPSKGGSIDDWDSNEPSWVIVKEKI